MVGNAGRWTQKALYSELVDHCGVALAHWCVVDHLNFVST